MVPVGKNDRRLSDPGHLDPGLALAPFHDHQHQRRELPAEEETQGRIAQPNEGAHPGSGGFATHTGHGNVPNSGHLCVPLTLLLPTVTLPESQLIGLPMPNDQSSLPAVFSIPGADGHLQFPISPGTTTTFCGANGSGKTRLAVHIEQELGLVAHRISAHRALSLNPSVPKISEREALNGLRTGFRDSHRQANQLSYRQGHRWQGKEATWLLNDYDYLVQALFAEQANTALASHRRLRAGTSDNAEPTNFEDLSEIWDRLLPHRSLEISGDDITVRIPDQPATYPASEMSDGERAVFYLVGQTLVAGEGSVLIVDEPELHLHPSIMTLLWDELGAARPDCAFVFITHSLEFAAARPGAKYLVRKYHPLSAWTIDPVPEDTGFSEEFTTLILGARRPVLFVEGTASSLDRSIYDACYPGHLILPLASCEAVIHAVASMRTNAALTRVTCHGIVDGDHRTANEIEYLRGRGVIVLPVAELENVFLLPEVSRTIAEYEAHEGDGLDARLKNLQQAVFESIASSDQKRATELRYVTRQVDRALKRVDLSAATSVEELETCYRDNVVSLDVGALTTIIEHQIDSAIQADDLPTLLAIYENKGLLALAAKHLKGTNLKSFKAWLERVLRKGSAPELTRAIRHALPDLPLTVLLQSDRPERTSNNIN